MIRCAPGFGVNYFDALDSEQLQKIEVRGPWAVVLARTLASHREIYLWSFPYPWVAPSRLGWVPTELEYTLWKARVSGRF